MKGEHMQYIEVVQSGLDYIEDNLKSDITAEELSDFAGFSLFHYYRLFENAVGMPVMQYIVRRRLLWSAYEIAADRKVIDVALEYGFDTAAGFYKAFRREFGCSPSEYAKRFKACKPHQIILLQEEHIMITQRRIKSILKSWNLQNETIRNIVLSPKGNINENAFNISDKYVLKVSANLGRLKSNIAITNALNNTEIPFAKTIKTLDGNDYVCDGELYFMLAERIEGEPIISSEIYEDNYEEKAKYIGQIIGKFHLALETIDNVVCNERNIFDEVKESWLEKAKCAANLTDDFCTEYLKTFGNLHDKLPVQIIHRDLNPSNIIMKDGKLSGFVDFDLSQRSIRIFDPCYAATAILSETFEENNNGKMTKWFEIYKNIIYGYDGIVNLTSEEKQAIPYVLLSIQIICVGYFNEKEKYKELAKVNIVMLKWLIENRNLLDIE